MVRLIGAMVFLSCLCTAAVAVVATGKPDEPETYAPDDRPRLALVIGVARYEALQPLRNSRADAQMIASTLIGLGFDTEMVLDPDRERLQDALADYAGRLQETGNAISVVYYAGQGVSVGDEAYIFATDSSVNSPDDVRQNGLSAEAMISQTIDANAEGASFFFLDTSRSTPFIENTDTRGLSIGGQPAETPGEGPNDGGAGGGLRTPARGLAGVPEPAGVVVMYSAETGQVSFDGNGSNSPFAAALAEALATSDLDQFGLFRRVRDSVMETTGGGQIPAMNEQGSLSIILNFSGNLQRQEDAGSRAAKAIYEKEPGKFVPTYEDGSFALLVGVSDYQEVGGQRTWRDLPSVAADIGKLEAVLTTMHGFTVESVLDPTSDELERALESFINRHGAKPNARLLIYMAGHGVTTENFGRKTAWFVPADAPAMNPPAPFRNSALNLRRVEEWSETVEAKHVMWVFDSCFAGAAIRMIETRSEEADDGWSAHLHSNPVRRVLTAGSENEEVPADSIFTARLIDVLSGETGIGENGMITGRQIGEFLREDVIRHTYRQGEKVTPQSDTIVIPGEEGDMIFRIEPQLVAKWQEANRPPQ